MDRLGRGERRSQALALAAEVLALVILDNLHPVDCALILGNEYDRLEWAAEQLRHLRPGVPAIGILLRTLSNSRANPYDGPLARRRLRGLKQRIHRYARQTRGGR